jgi:hypothetical protein
MTITITTTVVVVVINMIIHHSTLGFEGIEFHRFSISDTFNPMIQITSLKS